MVTLGESDVIVGQVGSTLTPKAAPRGTSVSDRNTTIATQIWTILITDRPKDREIIVDRDEPIDTFPLEIWVGVGLEV